MRAPLCLGRDAMNKKPYWSILALAILAGFLGGAVASRLFVTQAVFAEKKSTVIEANKFVVKDSTESIRAIFGINLLGEPSLSFFDANGTALITLYTHVYEGKSRRVSLVLFDEKRNVIWSTPE